MGLLRLAVCVGGVYSTFLLWAIAQERLVSVPFPSIDHPSRLQPPAPDGSHQGDRFPSPLFLNFIQAIASSLSALIYLVLGAYRDGSLRSRTLGSIVGWDQLWKRDRTIRSTPRLLAADKLLQEGGSDRRRSSTDEKNEDEPAKGIANGRHSRGDSVHRRGQSAHGLGLGIPDTSPKGFNGTPFRKTLLGLVLQVAAFQTTAGPIGFLALEHISYPTMVLGKSCKLIPVLLLNVLIYRRRFSSHKYLVVGLVTLGISLFMLLGEKKKKGGSDSVWGLSLLVINLLIDGLTNSTQDQIFSTYSTFTGQQMMFTMAILTQLILFPFLIIPFPTHPWSILHHLPIPLATHLLPQVSGAPIISSPPAAWQSISFLLTHPTAVRPMIAYACLGGLGQLFIFETIQHFGSLTLVMVTVTRKLFTMLLSVIVFEHHLSPPQWLGVAVVFGGIGVEAGFKRREMIKRTRRDRQ